MQSDADQAATTAAKLTLTFGEKATEAIHEIKRLGRFHSVEETMESVIGSALLRPVTDHRDDIIAALGDRASDYSDEIHKLREALRLCWNHRYNADRIDEIVRSVGEAHPTS